jgi:SAM-dependent methyltransferase
VIAPGASHAARLRRALDRARYDQTNLEALLGAPDARLSRDEQRALWGWRARSDRDGRAVLARLFLLEVPVAVAAARRALGDAGLEAALALSLVRARGATLEPRAQIGAHAGLLLAGDLELRPGARGVRRDHAGGPTTATILLDRLTVRRRVARALDLGCGGGYLALRLASHATAVWAADVSPRALRYGSLNAALNGFDARVRFLASDRFSGLARETFDLIAGNLPFVISPDARFVFRDAGLRSDGFLASVVRATGRHLVEGGIAQYLGQWVHRDETGGAEAEERRLATWVHAAGCDALVIRLERDPVDAYATRWLAGPEGPLSADERAQRMARWMAHYRRGGIRAISTGVICLRRRARGPHLFAIEESSAASPPDGETIASWFEGRSFTPAIPRRGAR